MLLSFVLLRKCQDHRQWLWKRHVIFKTKSIKSKFMLRLSRSKNPKLFAEIFVNRMVHLLTANVVKVTKIMQKEKCKPANRIHSTREKLPYSVVQTVCNDLSYVSRVRSAKYLRASHKFSPCYQDNIHNAEPHRQTYCNGKRRHCLLFMMSW